MSDEKMTPFEAQFDEKPTRLGGFELEAYGEFLGVYMHEGWVECPIFPAAETDVKEINPFLLKLTPREARDLAGLLTYAAGRADEATEHCVGCGEPLDDDDDEEDC
jgi:hypothetical protein